VAEASVDDSGNLSAATVSVINTRLASFLSTSLTQAIPMVLLHSPATQWVLIGGQPRRVPIGGFVPLPTVVTGFTASSTVASQRRRLRR
jgi:hypothetical protein